DIPDKVPCGQSGKCFCKRMDNQIIESRSFQNVNFFIYGIQQLYMCILLKDHTGMGEKSENHGFKAKSVRAFYKAIQNFHMAYVQTVKSTYGNSCRFFFVVFRDVLDRYHEYKIIKRLTFGTGLYQLDDHKITSSFFNNHSICML